MVICNLIRLYNPIPIFQWSEYDALSMTYVTIGIKMSNASILILKLAFVMLSSLDVLLFPLFYLISRRRQAAKAQSRQMVLKTRLMRIHFKTSRSWEE